MDFEERHELASIEAQKKRIAYSEARLQGAEDPKGATTFRVRLPKRYSPKKRYGLLIWVSPDPKGHAPRDWGRELDRRGLILVGPDGAGNDQLIPRRIALALNAVAGASARFSVDSKRVYAMGFSGGGNLVCWLGLHYPDVFAGVAPLSGCDTYRPVPIPGKKGSFWRGSIPEPKPELLAKAKKIPFHYVSGDADPQPKIQAEAVSKLHETLGFERVSLRIVPKLDHAPLSGKQLRPVLKSLTEPSKKKKKEPRGS